jgi:membrane protein DedA with SNARE-associated domain
MLETLPTFENLYEMVVETARVHRDKTALIVFCLGLAESIPFISLLVPSTILLLAIGALYAEAGGSFWHLAAAGAAGAFLGDVLTFIVGWRYRHHIAGLWPFTRDPSILPRSQAFFERHGAGGVIASKFLGAIRAFVPLVAGMLDMPWALFLLASLSSSLIWACFFLAPGFGLSFLLG